VRRVIRVQRPSQRSRASGPCRGRESTAIALTYTETETGDRYHSLRRNIIHNPDIMPISAPVIITYILLGVERPRSVSNCELSVAVFCS